MSASSSVLRKRSPANARSAAIKRTDASTANREEVEDRLLVVESQLGWLALLVGELAVRRLTFGHPDPQSAMKCLDLASCDVGKPNADHRRWIKHLVNFAAGRVDSLHDVPIDERSYTPFQLRVIRACRVIPYGETMTYGELAAAAGSPKAARSVGTVMSSNRYPLIVPCHRVVGAAGCLGGYSGYNGLSMKTRLLQMEAESLQRSVSGRRSAQTTVKK